MSASRIIGSVILGGLATAAFGVGAGAVKEIIDGPPKPSSDTPTSISDDS